MNAPAQAPLPAVNIERSIFLVRGQKVLLDRDLSKSVFAFTEQGVAMLSGLLNTPRAIAVNIGIMRAIVRLRQLIASHADLSRKIDALEKKYDEQFRVVFDVLRTLMDDEETVPPAREIGYHASLSALVPKKPRAKGNAAVAAVT